MLLRIVGIGKVLLINYEKGLDEERHFFQDCN